MSAYLEHVIKKELKPKVQTLFDDLKARKDPNYFWPTGTQVYCGRQGSGKTISAVKHVLDLKKRYPAAILVANVKLSGFKPLRFNSGNKSKDLKDLIQVTEHAVSPSDDYIYFETMDELTMLLTNVNNGRLGVIYFVDEIHTYFNALDSKNIPMYVFTEISQQRKQRKLIIGTSQLFLRMAKPFREQCDNLIICRTFLGLLTFQAAYDGMTLDQDYDGKLTGHIKKRGWFWHTRKIRSVFDTYQKVVSGAEQYQSVVQLNLVAQDKIAKKLGKK